MGSAIMAAESGGTKMYKHLVTGKCGDDSDKDYEYYFFAPWDQPITEVNLFNNRNINPNSRNQGKFIPQFLWCSGVVWYQNAYISWNFASTLICCSESVRVSIKTVTDTVTML